MRRLALFGLLPFLAGCHYAANPTVDEGKFLADVHSIYLNPNTPPPVTEDEKLAEGAPVLITPLTPEPGEVWPGPPPPIPTMQDVQSLTNMQFLPPANIPSAPPPPVFPQNAPGEQQSVPPPGTMQKTP